MDVDRGEQIMQPDFRDLADAKKFIGDISKCLPKNFLYYEDFVFFSSINCTTQSEYREELKAFLERFISEIDILSMPDKIKVMYPQLVKLYDWL